MYRCSCCRLAFEPFALRKFILQTRMRSHPVVLVVWILVGPFAYFHISCVQIAKALVRLRECAGTPEHSLVAYVISTIISWAGSFRSPHAVERIDQLIADLLCYCCCRVFAAIWAASWQNKQNGTAHSEDSDQPGHPPSLIRVFAVRMKKAWALSYPLSAQRRLIRLGR